MGIAEIRGKKLVVGWGYRIISAKQITLKDVFSYKVQAGMSPLPGGR